jgi:E3 ubiquitin-protein ligase HECTD2
MGLAVYNSITLDIRFPPCCYKKLLSPPVVPSDQSTPVGICSVTIDDLCQVMPVSMLLPPCGCVVLTATLFVVF